MSKVTLSLNFMYHMERFATQIYLTQMGSFTGQPLAQKLAEASGNESTHVQRLRAEIKRLNGTVCPFGWLFQFMGVVLGCITRLAGKRNLFKADTFVEVRAVTDYGGFLRTINFNPDTVQMIKKIIAEEEVHIANWKKAGEEVSGRRGGR